MVDDHFSHISHIAHYHHNYNQLIRSSTKSNSIYVYLCGPTWTHVELSVSQCIYDSSHHITLTIEELTPCREIPFQPESPWRDLTLGLRTISAFPESDEMSPHYADITFQRCHCRYNPIHPSTNSRPPPKTSQEGEHVLGDHDGHQARYTKMVPL
jgi:hypothetical protein